MGEDSLGSGERPALDRLRHELGSFTNYFGVGASQIPYESRMAGREVDLATVRMAFALAGGDVVPTPEAEIAQLDLVPVEGAGPVICETVIPIWTRHGGRSDYGLQVRVVELDHGRLGIQTTGFMELDVSELPEEGPIAADEAAQLARWQARVRSDVADREGRRPRSDAPIPIAWRPAIEEIVRRLVNRDYAGLAADGIAGGVDADDEIIGLWIERYPFRIIELPTEEWEYADHEPPGDGDDRSNIPAYVGLWTAEEGRSDLTLVLFVDDTQTPPTFAGHVYTM